MDSFSKIVREIQSVKIQGAEAVAIASVQAIKQHVSGQKLSSSQLFHELEACRKALIGTRPTEPLMHNGLSFVIDGLKSERGKDPEILKRLFVHRCNEALAHFDRSRKRIAEIGSGLIENKVVVFTHCHSSSVVAVLLAAKKKGRHFSVMATETRPLFQGRRTAAELAKAGIPVTLFVDSAARFAVKEADIMLLGADEMTSDGRIINKIGSELFSIIAGKYDVPVYACMDSWKLSPKSLVGLMDRIEQRPSREVWDRPPKGVVVRNPAFEKILPELITGVISELGIYSPDVFVEEVRKAYPWMF
jgi:ribose 1,5-bisphosphate isomerase